MSDKTKIIQQVKASAATVGSLAGQAESIQEICTTVIAALKGGNKVLTAGNGGSAAEALHMSEELVGRYRGNRVSLPAIALVADPTAMTCIGNDFGFDEVFARQIEGLGKPGDVLVLFSTSGNAVNLKRALDAAQAKDMSVICLLGRDGGPLAGQGQHELIVKSDATERVQEAHILLVHVILEAVEDAYMGQADDS